MCLVFNLPSSKDALYLVWLKFAQGFWRRRKCELFLTTTKITDDGNILIKNAHLNLWLSGAKKWRKQIFFGKKKQEAHGPHRSPEKNSLNQ